MLSGLAPALSFTLALMTAGSMSLDTYLERTIQRGVPLFNEGDPAACAAVYATALEGIAAAEGFGLPAPERQALGTWLDLAAAIEDPAEQAWAYRRLIDQLLREEPIEAPPLGEAITLFDFSDPASVDRWRIVLDGVMGGLSTGNLAAESGKLVFTGETSLRNNGGFSSIRARVPPGSLAGYDTLRFRVLGDGRTYIVGTSTQTGRGDSYWTRFDTVEGEWQTITVPIRSMVRQFFGQPIPGQITPSAVRGLEFYIYDKEAGPFRLELERIEAIRS